MPFARFLRIMWLGVKSLWLQKLRSSLTMLGIVFGVFSVIAMLAIGEGASDQAQRQVVELGATNIIVRSIKPLDESSSNASMRSTPRYGLLRSDVQRLQDTISPIVKATPIREIPREGRYLSRTVSGRLVGCTADYLEVNRLKMASGKFLTSSHNQSLANVVVLAAETANALFPMEDPLGKAVQIAGHYYRVIGVTANRTASAAIGGSLSAQEYNKDFYIPINTLRARIGDQIFTPKQGGLDSEHVELNQVTFSIRDRDQVLPVAEQIRDTIQRFHTQKDFDVVVPLELLKQADQLRLIFNVVLGSIAAISLIVGGIGIMNIMLATVTERTREIGIRRALGAQQRDIIEQFLTETVVLSGTGGVLGVVLGWLTPYTFAAVRELALRTVIDSKNITDSARLFTEMQPRVSLWSLILAFGISVLVGVVFGLYPASSAARLDPIEALRHE